MNKALMFIFLLASCFYVNAECLAESAFSGVQKISMERTACYGKCPQYTVIFQENGNAVYDGEANVKKIGLYRGAISKENFAQLAKLLEAAKFLELKDQYVSGLADLPQVIIKVLVGDVEKEVIADSKAIPKTLEDAEKAIDEIVSRIVWQKA